MSSFTSLSVGVSGLKANQHAINTTAHNLANVDTEGFVRQQPIFSDTNYIELGRSSLYIYQKGIGTDLAAVRHIRDTLLDKAYRVENGRMQFYQSQYNAIVEIEEAFGELEGVAFQKYLTDFNEAVQEIVKDPASQVTRSELVQKAYSFLSRANAIYNNLETYQNTLNTEVENKVNRINELGDLIHALNKKISQAEAGDVENANDFRDQRDNALDELSSMVSIRYAEDPLSHIVTVKVEGVSFVTESNVHHMGTKMLDTDKDSVLLTPVWPYLKDNPVYNLKAPVSTKNNNDIGSLHATLLARGNCTANYLDIPDADDYYVEPDANGFVDGTKSPAYKRLYNNAMQEAASKLKRTDYGTDADYEVAVKAEASLILTTAGINAGDYGNGKDSVAFKRDLKTYEEEIEPSSIKTVMAEFDQMVNAMVESMNDVLCPNITAEALDQKAGAGTPLIGMTYVDPSGVTRVITKDTKFFDVEKAGYGCALNQGKPSMTELFVRDDVSRYSEITVNGQTFYVYNDFNKFGNESLYTLGNISVNPDLLHDFTLLPLSTKDGGEDRARAEALGEAWDNASLKLTPSYNTQKKFLDYYTEFTGQMANAGDMYTNMIDYQDDLTTGINDGRQRITGVSSDEELTNLIKFQAAYNACSRYINVVDEMLEHLVTRL